MGGQNVSGNCVVAPRDPVVITRQWISEGTRAAALLIAAGLGGCAEPPSDAACYIQPSTFDISNPPPARMFMKGYPTWCSYGMVRNFASGPQYFSYGYLISSPRNGEVTLRRNDKGSPVFWYRPKPGFVGEDAFDIEVGPAGGRRTVWVTVRKPDAVAASPQPTQAVAPAVAAPVSVPVSTPSAPAPTQFRSLPLSQRMSSADRANFEASCVGTSNRGQTTELKARLCSCVADEVQRTMTDIDRARLLVRAADIGENQAIAESPKMVAALRTCSREL